MPIHSSYYSDKESRREIKSMRKAARKVIKDGKAKEFVEEIHKAIGIKFDPKTGKYLDKDGNPV